MRGRVKWYNEDKGYGFVIADNGIDFLFTHYSYFKDADTKLQEGDVVEFEVVVGARGEYANNVYLVGKQSFDIEGTIETDVDEDTFNTEFLKWIESKGWTFAGFTKPTKME